MRATFASEASIENISSTTISTGTSTTTTSNTTTTTISTFVSDAKRVMNTISAVVASVETHGGGEDTVLPQSSKQVSPDAATSPLLVRYAANSVQHMAPLELN